MAVLSQQTLEVELASKVIHSPTQEAKEPATERKEGVLHRM